MRTGGAAASKVDMFAVKTELNQYLFFPHPNKVLVWEACYTNPGAGQKALSSPPPALLRTKRALPKFSRAPPSESSAPALALERHGRSARPHATPRCHLPLQPARCSQPPQALRRRPPESCLRVSEIRRSLRRAPRSPPPLWWPRPRCSTRATRSTRARSSTCRMNSFAPAGEDQLLPPRAAARARSTRRWWMLTARASVHVRRFRLGGIFLMAQTCRALEHATSTERRARGSQLVLWLPPPLLVEYAGRGAVHLHACVWQGTHAATCHEERHGNSGCRYMFPPPVLESIEIRN